MKIYEYNEAIEACLNSNAEGVDEETGLVFDSALLDRLDMDRDEKLENLILYEEQLKLDAAELKDYADKLIARAKAKKNKAESLKAWLCEEITRYGAKKFESVKIRATVTERQSTQIYDTNLIPPEYIRTKTEKEPDKIAIGKLLKEGTEVPGAVLQTNKSLSVR